MTNHLTQQLDADSLLLMYVAGELSLRDHAEVERRLAGDAALAARADQLRAAHESVSAMLSKLDASDALPVDESIAVRNVAQAIRQRQARSAGADRVQTPAARGHKTWNARWVVGLGAAAAVAAIAVLVVPHGGGRNTDPSPPKMAAADPAFDREAVESLASAGRFDNASDAAVSDVLDTAGYPLSTDASKNPLESPVFNVEEPQPQQ